MGHSARLLPGQDYRLYCKRGHTLLGLYNAAILGLDEFGVVYHFKKIPVSSVGKFRTGRIVYHLQNIPIMEHRAPQWSPEDLS